MEQIESFSALRRINTIFKVSRNTDIGVFMLVAYNVVTKVTVVRFIYSETELLNVVNYILQSEKGIAE